ncbi:DUF456 domain-containing protein [Halorarius litoreus]|uniref:DUF456 domain-containing protein n=1 Tax=Halorarius litoreus TaxID=2962676 RepID=UPI0020CF3B83|nr:DUF456 domain-containing protein [Halorarius litoreus]
MTEVLGLALVPLVTLLLLAAGVIGSILPGLPGASLSIVGVLFYWWQSGFTRPSALVLVALVGLGVLALLADWFGGAAAAKAGGASTTTTVVAAVVGLLLLFVAGPLGVVIGIGGTVFVLEYRENEDVEASLRATAYTTVGMLASAVVQALLTGTMLLAMLVVILL